ISVDFALKTTERDGETVVRLQLWDIAGKASRFIGHKQLKYYQQMFPARTQSETGQWKPLSLLSKCDHKEGNKQLSALMDNYCEEEGFLGWFETSAKDNLNVDEAGAFLVKHILQIDRGLSSRDNTCCI
ncbi:unnamed protein product, partial [Coregonus sp. 'balchen']